MESRGVFRQITSSSRSSLSRTDTTTITTTIYMNKTAFQKKLAMLQNEHRKLITRRNRKQTHGNGIFDRHDFPVLTAEHPPLSWRYDFNHASNPHLMTRLGINCAFNVGAMEWNGSIVLAARVEGWDRKSFFAIAESKTGVDGFQFWDYPVQMPELDAKETNLYDMRLVRHEDGWIYGLFCAERHDDSKPHDLSAAIARGGIARTKDLVKWERLPDLKTPALHQRNCVLHPEYVSGKYAFYTRPMNDFAATGSGDGVCWGLCDDITSAVVKKESIIDPRFYHTIKEGKNGDVFIYYGSSDTRTHVATSTVDKLLDYVMNTPEDGMRSKICVEQRCKLIAGNLRTGAKR